MTDENEVGHQTGKSEKSKYCIVWKNVLTTKAGYKVCSLG